MKYHLMLMMKLKLIVYLFYIKDGTSDNVSVRSKMLNRIELLAYLSYYSQEIYPEKENYKTTIGMVGYPNVGKSSVINALLGVRKGIHGKRVAVGSTPGKTKHFQTMELTNNMTLCDCPGLVFPSFVKTKSDMILNGILPIAQIRDSRRIFNYI